jgi:hypothetical protein
VWRAIVEEVSVGFFKGARGGGEQAEPGPDWAQPMSVLETVEFLEVVDRDLERRGLPHEIGDGIVRVEYAGETQEFGLTNLAQLCHIAGRQDWPEGIATHFDNMLEAVDAEAELNERARDFEGIRSLLKVRLYPGPSLQGTSPSPPVSWEVAPGLTGVFVYDLPTTVRTVSSEHVEAWGKGHAELLQVALANVRDDAVDETPMGEGEFEPIACSADHFFAASHALLLGERLPPRAGGMAVFAVPNRHLLLYAPIVDLGVVESINRLIVTSVSLFNEGPGSISPSIYWWRDGAVTLLPSEIAGRNVQFAPPDEFVEVLNALPPG